MRFILKSFHLLLPHRHTQQQEGLPLPINFFIVINMIPIRKVYFSIRNVIAYVKISVRLIHSHIVLSLTNIITFEYCFK